MGAETQSDGFEFGHTFQKNDRVRVELHRFFSDSVWIIDPRLTFTGTIAEGPHDDLITVLPDINLPKGHQYANKAPRGFHEQPFWYENDDGSVKHLLRFRILPEILAATGE